MEQTVVTYVLNDRHVTVQIRESMQQVASKYVLKFTLMWQPLLTVRVQVFSESSRQLQPHSKPWFGHVFAMHTENFSRH